MDRNRKTSAMMQTTNSKRDQEFIYGQWMKLLMLNVSGMDVLGEFQESQQISPEQMRASFSLGFRFAMDRTREFVEKHCDLSVQERNMLVQFLTDQSEISYLLSTVDQQSELAEKLKNKDGWGFGGKSVLDW